MRNQIRKWIKEYNEFSKTDRNAILVLCVLIFLTLIINIIVQNIEPKTKYDISEYEKLFREFEFNKHYTSENRKSLFFFDLNTISPEQLDSLDLPDFVKRNILDYRDAGGRFTSKNQLRKIYGMNDSIFGAIEKYIVILDTEKEFKPNKTIIQNNGFFDPNLAESEQLLKFGFNQFQAQNLIKFRKKGGIIKKPEDLLKIYGIDSAFYFSIKENIKLANHKETIEIETKINTFNVEINSADSVILVNKLGLLPAQAGRIVKYRKKLGGFYTLTQLLEVYNFPEETFRAIENNISVDTSLIIKIRINFAEYTDLLRHPYLNKNQVKSILDYRDKNGAFTDTGQLITNGLLDSETFNRIRPYLTGR